MAEFKLDGLAVAVEGGTLLRVLAELEIQARQQGRIVQRLVVDGAELATLEPVALNEVTNYQQVEGFTVGVAAHIRQVLAEGRDFLQDLRSVAREVAERLTASGYDQATHQSFLCLLSGLEQFVDLNDLLLATGQLDFARPLAAGKSATQLTTENLRTLTELGAAQAAGDTGKMAEIVRYELTPRLAQWDVVFDEFTAQLPS